MAPVADYLLKQGGVVTYYVGYVVKPEDGSMVPKSMGEGVAEHPEYNLSIKYETTYKVTTHENFEEAKVRIVRLMDSLVEENLLRLSWDEVHRAGIATNSMESLTEEGFKDFATNGTMSCVFGNKTPLEYDQIMAFTITDSIDIEDGPDFEFIEDDTKSL